ncbi:zn 2cys6 transcription factor [Ophiostoma piceae UAMH 11346]|uniref:Zn 2cys6 transcription factor n=1 Tax=Ophiostoma piceae (strain UAMH 11346) TaxID=1262450 RepID=S3CP89_OPHP1|nr:zn 2cys6 transcription factor [Ophiostoma piceae UAMH 11346]
MPVSDTTPYGRACNQCVKAKAKCTLREGACDRCLRLKKDCQPAVGARRKPGRKPAASRTDALEARLNGIMSLLGTVPGLHGPDSMDSSSVQSLLQEQPEHIRQLQQSVPPLHHPLMSDMPQRRSPPQHNLSATNTCSIDFHTKRITYSPHEVYMKGPINQQAFAGTMANDPAPAHTSHDYHTQQRRQQQQHQHQPQDGPSPAIDDLLGSFPGLSTREAEDALNRFRLRKVKYFPFVHIPEARISAYRLRQTRPMLWLSIMACSAHSADLQDRLCLRMRQVIAQQAIVQHQRSLDLLLGIVGFLGWGMYYLKRDPFMLMYCHIATALVQDLGLDRDPPAAKAARAPQPNVRAPSEPVTSGTPSTNTALNTAEPHPLSCFRTHGFAIKLLESPVRTMEERRVVLGTYLITVLVSLFHRKPIALPWTDHMDECLRVLEAEPETPLDRLLVYQCRLQRISLDIPGPQAYATISSAREMRMLRDFQVKALVARQRDVEALMPAFEDEPDLQDICRVSNVANEAAIYSVALYATNPSAEERARCGPDAERANLLHTCLRLHREYFDMTFGRDSTSTDKDSFFYMFSFHTVTHMSYFLVVAYRLAGFGRDDPGCGWDRNWAREQLDIPHMVATLAQRFSEASTHFSPSGSDAGAMLPPAAESQDDFFSRAARAMDMLRTTWMTTWADDNEIADRNEDRETQADKVFTPVMDFTQEPLIVFDELFSMGGTGSAWLPNMFSDGR